MHIIFSRLLDSYDYCHGSSCQSGAVQIPRRFLWALSKAQAPCVGATRDSMKALRLGPRALFLFFSVITWNLLQIINIQPLSTPDISVSHSPLCCIPIPEVSACPDDPFVVQVGLEHPCHEGCCWSDLPAWQAWGWTCPSQRRIW